jgi:3-hydroxyisobutyrate dehydrogenase-like beta-hydroxyacid dehydrogenase
VSAWDRKFDDVPQRDAARAFAVGAGVLDAASMADMLARSTIVFSAVTASQTLAVAREAAAHLAPGTVFIDLNSASPGTKTACAEAIEAIGGRYVEAAVMASVPPYGLRVPMLLGGPHAHAIAPQLRGWGLDATAAADRLGEVSAIKMCRSVIVKGLEALVIESFTAARAHGVEDPLLASLRETLPGIDWEKQAAYFFERVIQHGQRRAEEMVECAATVTEVGIGAHMAAAASQRQAWVAALAREGAFAGGADTWRSRADAALAALGRPAG